jgi:hypothetical protein
MVLPGHIAGGYLAARGLLAIFHPGFSSTEIDSLLIIGTLAGELPDIDLIKLYFDHKLERPNRVNDHRIYFTHAPFFWLVISLLIVAGGYLAGSLFTEWIGWLVLVGSWSHLILDSLEYGVMWLWPWSNKCFALKKKVPIEDIAARPGSPSYHLQYINRVYWKTITFWSEIILTLAALYLIC